MSDDARSISWERIPIRQTVDDVTYDMGIGVGDRVKVSFKPIDRYERADDDPSADGLIIAIDKVTTAAVRIMLRELGGGRMWTFELPTSVSIQSLPSIHDVIVDGKQTGLSVARIELGERVERQADSDADCDGVSDSNGDTDDVGGDDKSFVTISNYGKRIAGGYSADAAKRFK